MATRAARRRDLAVVVNGRASSTSDSHHLLTELEGHLRSFGARVTTTVTQSEAEMRDALDAAAGRRVVLVGGDGTLHAAANAPVELPEVALVPAGRANNIARALGVPGRIADAARLAATAEVRPVDVLRVETDGGTVRALEAVSAGLQADARARYDGVNSGDLRAGARSLAAAVHDYHPWPVEIETEGKPVWRAPAAQVFFSNLPFFGFGFHVDPVADPRDGMLEAIVLRASSRSEAVSLLASAYRGHHLRRAGLVRRARSAKLIGSPPLVVDGTPLAPGGAEVIVEPGALKVAA